MGGLKIAAALGLIGALAGASPALAQVAAADTNDLDSPSALRCSALSSVAPDALPNAIAYIAGYGNGERDAITFANVATTTETTTETADAATTTTTAPDAVASATTTVATATAETPAVPRPGGPSAAILPAIPVEAIAAPCAQSPDSRVLDIITAQGVMNAQ